MMVGRTLTRSQLSEAVYQEVGLSRSECSELLESVLSMVSETLTKGESVKISTFGTFSVKSKNRRIGRNPKTGEEVPILPRRVLVFRPSQVLKNRITRHQVINNPVDENDHP
jgi:integration host factor subunit alpha